MLIEPPKWWDGASPELATLVLLGGPLVMTFLIYLAVLYLAG